MQNGTLIVEVFLSGEALPVNAAEVTIQNPSTGETTVLYTDQDGRTEIISIPAPDVEASLSPDSGTRPYSSVNVVIRRAGFADVSVNGVQIFPGIESILPVEMQRSSARTTGIQFDIPENALEQTPPFLPEGPSEDSRVLAYVYIPSYVTVHLGSPDSYARNVRVSFQNYIKNVASSEIYPTWPENAIRANIHAQIGFVLNRIFTEWYPSRGYNFDITNSTAYDQFFVEGRNIFDNISRIVDEIFNLYPRRQGYVNPLFSQYCNGSTVTCSGLSQWGTVTLANRGYTPLQMLRYYYGNNVVLTEANDIRNIESSYPGTALRVGSSGPAVRTIQRQLSRIRRNYPGIPAVSIDGVFGSQTQAAVRKFQQLFNLTQDGIVGKSTWNRLSYIYVAVTNLAELSGEGETAGILPYPGYLIRRGQSGENVRIMQQYLSDLSVIYSQIPSLTADGIFGSRTENAIRAFQRLFGLSPDGIVGSSTWNKLTEVWGWYYA